MNLTDFDHAHPIVFVEDPIKITDKSNLLEGEPLDNIEDQIEFNQKTK